MGGQGGVAIAPGGQDFDAVRDVFFELLDVGDDADQPALLPEDLQAVHDVVERVMIQRAEAFVEEQRVDAGVAGHVGEPQGKGQTDNEGFAAGEVGAGAGGVVLVAVDDGELQRIPGIQHKGVAVVELGKLGIGMPDELLEGDDLGVAQERVFGAAENGVESPPVFQFLPDGSCLLPDPAVGVALMIVDGEGAGESLKLFFCGLLSGAALVELSLELLAGKIAGVAGLEIAQVLQPDPGRGVFFCEGLLPLGILALQLLTVGDERLGVEVGTLAVKLLLPQSAAEGVQAFLQFSGQGLLLLLLLFVLPLLLFLISLLHSHPLLIF